MLSHPYFIELMANDRQQAIAADARAARRRTTAAPVAPPRPEVTIRLAQEVDRSALDRLALLSERPLPHSRLLVAEVEGELRAAVPLSGGSALTDPFHATTDLVSLLDLRVAQLAPPRGRLARLKGRGALRPISHVSLAVRGSVGKAAR